MTLRLTPEQLDALGHEDTANEQRRHEKAVARKHAQIMDQFALPGVKEPKLLERQIQHDLVAWLDCHRVPYIVNFSGVHMWSGFWRFGAFNRTIAENPHAYPLDTQRTVADFERGISNDTWAAIKRMEESGLRKGRPDLCIPVPVFDAERFVRDHDNGESVEVCRALLRWCVTPALFVDLKRGKSGRISAEQEAFADTLRQYGNRVEFPDSLEAAKAVVRDHCHV